GRRSTPGRRGRAAGARSSCRCTRTHPSRGRARQTLPRSPGPFALPAAPRYIDEIGKFPAEGQRRVESPPVATMSALTRILAAVEQGDPQAAEQLLPLVYDELRKLAAQRLAQEKPGQTLEPTALVHEAYLRLVDRDQDLSWDGRGHFFAAAA